MQGGKAMLVKCTAQTCIHYRNGMCTSESIEMVDFEYYLTIENKKREIILNAQIMSKGEIDYGSGE